jgi:hypothetical protein
MDLDPTFDSPKVGKSEAPSSRLIADYVCKGGFF